MCGFQYCKGKHACFLADISPCPEYENAKALEELTKRMRRPNSRPGPGFVDIDEFVAGADAVPANYDTAARIIGKLVKRAVLALNLSGFDQGANNGLRAFAVPFGVATHPCNFLPFRVENQRDRQSENPRIARQR